MIYKAETYKKFKAKKQGDFMSKADELFVTMCRDIIENGWADTDCDVRPKWEDGTPAHTVKKFGVVNRYDLSKEFPAQTIRKTFIKRNVCKKGFSKR